MEWDEGPDCGGEYGPYRQSERLEIHQKVVQRLIDEGHAYRCFCSAERLDALRKEQMANKETPRYDGHCLSLSEDEVREKMERENLAGPLESSARRRMPIYRRVERRSSD